MKSRVVDKGHWSGANVILFELSKIKISSIFEALNTTHKNLLYYKNPILFLKVIYFILKISKKFSSKKSKNNSEDLCIHSFSTIFSQFSLWFPPSIFH